MSLNYQKDPATQVPTLATGLDGVDSIVKFYQNGTNEIKNLLKNECSVIYECSYCRSLFRSIVNFVAHKRTICRSLQMSVRLEIERTGALKRANTDSDRNVLATSSRSRRNPNSLRRVNLASLLGKHIQNFNLDLEEIEDSIEVQTLPKISRPTVSTSFRDGKQVIDVLPSSLSVKDRIPSDRTVLVMPQGNTIRYREMQLRTRRNANDAKSVVCRELGQNDMEILQRIPPALLESTDLQELRCLYEECLNVQPFVSVAILAHHLAITHQKDLSHMLSLNNNFACFTCGKLFENDRLLQDHFKEAHADERAAHVKQRIELAKLESAARATTTLRRGTTIQKKRSSSPEEENLRFRSISPVNLSGRNSVASIEFGAESGENSQHDTGSELNDELGLSQNQSDNSNSSVAANRADEAPAGCGLTVTRRRRPNSAAAMAISSRRNSPRLHGALSNVSSPSKSSDLQIIKRMKLEEKVYQKTSINEIAERTMAPLLSSVEARRIDELLNTSSSTKSCILEKEESEDEDIRFGTKTSIKGLPIKMNITTNNDTHIADNLLKSLEMAGGRLQRKKKPTKRFYNEDFVVDPTKAKINITPITELKEKRPKSRESAESTLCSSVEVIVAKQPNTSITTLTNRTKKKRKTNGVKKNPKRSRALRQRVVEISNKQENFESEDKSSEYGREDVNGEEQSTIEMKDQLLAADIIDKNENLRNKSAETLMTSLPDYNENAADLQFRKKVIDKVLSAEMENTEQLSNTCQQSPTLQKATSEPPIRREINEQLYKLKERADSALNLVSDNNENARRKNCDDIENKDNGEKNEPNNNNENRKGTAASFSEEKEIKEKSSSGFVYPPSLSAVASTSASSISSGPAANAVKNQLPSILADKNRELLAFYTPRARKARITDEERITEVSSTIGSSRRKQNLKEVNAPDRKDVPPPRPDDLAEVPVYLTEVQRDMFFSPLRPLFNSATASDGVHQCSECGEVLRCQRDGRRHMVGHLRVMRIRCMLCDVGAFFCGDMRIHLMFRHCEKLNLAPEGFVEPGDVVPCMDKRKADMLTQLVDPFHPGRVMFTSGKIISWTNPKAYFPDPRIEERILGKARPRRSTSLAPSPVKSTSTLLQQQYTTSGSPGPCKKLNFDHVSLSRNDIHSQKEPQLSVPVSLGLNAHTMNNGINVVGKSPLTQHQRGSVTASLPSTSANIGGSPSASSSSWFQPATLFTSSGASPPTMPNILSVPHKVLMMKPAQPQQTPSTSLATPIETVMESDSLNISETLALIFGFSNAGATNCKT